jgi:hypothetical protein
MATSKPSGLARFTRQGSAPPAVSTPTEGTGTSAARPVAAPADTARTSGPHDAGTRGASKAKLVGVYLMPDGHRQLKIEAAKRGMTVSDLVRDAVNAWFTSEHLPPLA